MLVILVCQPEKQQLGFENEMLPPHVKGVVGGPGRRVSVNVVRRFEDVDLASGVAQFTLHGGYDEVFEIGRHVFVPHGVEVGELAVAFEGVRDFDGGDGAVVEVGEHPFEIDDAVVRELDCHSDGFAEVAVGVAHLLEDFGLGEDTCVSSGEGLGVRGFADGQGEIFPSETAVKSSVRNIRMKGDIEE